jgi:hypothetical protein
MAQDEGIRNMKTVVWGIFLIALGGLFLLERFGTWGFAGIGAWWPLILIVIGIIQLLERRVGSALTMILLGSWFLTVTSGWMGLTYGNSWSLVLVAVGAGIVVKALTGEERRRDPGAREAHLD